MIDSKLNGELWQERKKERTEQKLKQNHIKAACDGLSVITNCFNTEFECKTLCESKKINCHNCAGCGRISAGAIERGTGNKDLEILI